MGSFEGVYTGDEGWSKGGDKESMNNAFGSSGASKGGPLESPEDNFIGRSMNQGALGDPGNALPSVNSAKPESDDSFDCMCDHYPTNS